MTRVAIFGSCVTADAFDYAVEPLREVFYSSRTSFACVLTPPLAMANDALPWASNFARQRVLADFRKTVLDDLAATEPDAVVFDFIDDRHDLLRCGETVVLDSQPLRESGFPGGLPWTFERLYRSSKKCGALWRESAIRVAETFARRLPSARLVLHRAWWAQEYADGGSLCNFSLSEQNEAAAMNALLAEYYAHWEAVCPGLATVEVELPRRAWKQHKWGLAPFHYEPAYYRRLIELLSETLLPARPCS